MLCSICVIAFCGILQIIMAALCSNWQAIMFYLFIYYNYYLLLFIYCTLIFEAEERRPVGP